MIRFVYACLPSEAAHCLGGNNTISHLSLIVFFLPLKTNTRNAKYYSSKRGRPFLFFVVVTSRCWSFAKTKRNTKKKTAQNEMRNSKAIVHSADRGPDTKRNAKHESFSLSDNAEFNCI